MTNEKKFFIISIFSILLIVFVVGLLQNTSNFENNLLGKAIQGKDNSYEHSNSTPKNRTTFSNLSSLTVDNRKCEAICPFGSEVLNASCNKINETCSGNVICGFYYNGTLMNMTNGNCAILNVIPDAR
jgi:hypothetical protein